MIHFFEEHCSSFPSKLNVTVNTVYNEIDRSGTSLTLLIDCDTFEHVNMRPKHVKLLTSII